MRKLMLCVLVVLYIVGTSAYKVDYNNDDDDDYNDDYNDEDENRDELREMLESNEQDELEDELRDETGNNVDPFAGLFQRKKKPSNRRWFRLSLKINFNRGTQALKKGFGIYNMVKQLLKKKNKNEQNAY